MRLIALFLALLAGWTGPAAATNVSSGRIDDLGLVGSRYVDARRVQVWLPDGYRPDGPAYPVIYMHDGQNLFDKADAAYGMEWQIDEVLGRLIADRAVRPAIVVGIANTPKRLQEYLPDGASAGLPNNRLPQVRALYGGDPLGDRYLDFIARELIPLIQSRYHVSRSARDRFIMGSSMGSIISLGAVVRYPRLFGGAAMMSTHWPQFKSAADKLSPSEFEEASASTLGWLRRSLPRPNGRKLYFDSGAEREDPLYAAYEDRVLAAVRARGYRDGVDLLVRHYPGQPHNEKSWASRVSVPLAFLLGR